MEDSIIESYFNELQSYLNTEKVYESNKKICITNNFNDYKIIVKKENFSKYCHYYEVLKSYKDLTIQETYEFSINIPFNDNISKYMTLLIDQHPYTDIKKFVFNMNELEQIIDIINLLQIELKNRVSK